MSNQTLDGAQALIKTLDDLGIEFVFGYSGGAAIPIFDALETVETKMKFILVRHEQGAVHMADGYARATGKPAAVLVTSGPGAGNTVTGLMTAQMDSVPMLVICGQQVTWMLGKDAFQEADIFGITIPVITAGSTLIVVLVGHPDGSRRNVEKVKGPLRRGGGSRVVDMCNADHHFIPHMGPCCAAQRNRGSEQNIAAGHG